MRLAVVSAICLVAGCIADDRDVGPDPEPTPTPTSTAVVAVDHAEPVAVAPSAPAYESQPVEVRDFGCAALTRSPLATATWWSKPSTACRPSLAASATPPGRVFYGECETQQVTLDGCSIEPGTATCYGGRWTLTCASDTDCPSLSRCSWESSVGSRPADRPGELGVCERQCNADSDCVHCGLVCNTHLGICGAAPPAPKERDPRKKEASAEGAAQAQADAEAAAEGQYAAPHRRLGWPLSMLAR